MRRIPIGFALAVATVAAACAAGGSSAHQDACHAARTCPSDAHSYVWSGMSCASDPKARLPEDQLPIDHRGVRYWCHVVVDQQMTPKGVTRTGTSSADLLTGTAFRDMLLGLGGSDRLFGKSGNDRIYGGAGNDTLTGGPGADFLEGGSGADTILARDARRDTIRCGAGNDTVTADPTDQTTNCEAVRRR